MNKNISIKAIEINSRQALFDNKKEYLYAFRDASQILIPLSLLIALIGFILWYDKTQHLQDSILKNQHKQYIKIENCQSCGIKLTEDDQFNKLSSDEKGKQMFCFECFKDGQFIEPNLVLKEVVEKVRNRCKELGFSKLQTFVYLLRIKHLDRWKLRFKWR